MRAWTSLVRVPVLLAPAVLLACGDDLGPRIPAAVVVTPDAPRIPVGETGQLTATVVDANGRDIPGLAVAFESSEPSILTVSESGLLTSVGPAGSSIITAASGDITAEIEAVVMLAPSAVVVSPASLELDTGAQLELVVTVTDENSNPVQGAEVAFQSSNPAIAFVEEADWATDRGYVTGLQTGTATVTVTSGELHAEVPVTVAQFPTRAAITPESVVLRPRDAQLLTATVLDRTGDAVPGYSFTWSSSDEAVLTVRASGQVISVGPEGSAIITASSDSFTASIGVFVGTPPAGAVLATVPLDWTYGVAWSPGGSRYFATSFDGIHGGTLPDFAFPVNVAVPGNPNDVAVDASASRAYVAGAEDDDFKGGIGVVDLATNALIDFIPVGLGWPLTMGLSGDGSTMVVGTDRGFEVVDVASKTSLGGSAVGQVTKITHHPLRPLLYATVNGKAVLELDAKSGEVTRTFPGLVEAHAVTPDGTRLYTVNQAGAIGVWNLDTGTEERGLTATGGGDLAISPDGKFLYVIWGSQLYIVDPPSGALVRTVNLGGRAWRIAMSRDGIAAISNFDYSATGGWIDFVR